MIIILLLLFLSHPGHTADESESTVNTSQTVSALSANAIPHIPLPSQNFISVTFNGYYTIRLYPFSLGDELSGEKMSGFIHTVTETIKDRYSLSPKVVHTMGSIDKLWETYVHKHFIFPEPNSYISCVYFLLQLLYSSEDIAASIQRAPSLFAFVKKTPSRAHTFFVHAPDKQAKQFCQEHKLFGR